MLDYDAEIPEEIEEELLTELNKRWESFRNSAAYRILCPTVSDVKDLRQLWKSQFLRAKVAELCQPVKDKELQTLFLNLWDKAVNTPGYSKEEWQAMRDKLGELKVIV